MSTDFDQIYEALVKQHILLVKQRDTINREIANICNMKLLVYPYSTRASSKIAETAGDLPWDA